MLCKKHWQVLFFFLVLCAAIIIFSDAAKMAGGSPPLNRVPAAANEWQFRDFTNDLAVIS